MYPSTYWEYHTLLLALAWIAGFAYGTWRGWAWPRSLGLALVAYPFAKLAIGVWLSFGLLFVPTVARPLSTVEIWGKILWHTIWYLVVPAIGLLLVYERFPGVARGPPRPRLLEDTGLAPRRSAETDTLSGGALLAGLIVAYIGAVVIVTSAVGRYVSTGDSSQVFVNVTFLTVLLLSLVAGVTEEFLFRGLLQSRLQRAMPFWAANALQAVAFGLVHAGYGNLAHVLAPLAFGLALGLVARRLGILAAIVLHAGIDVVALGLSNLSFAVLVLFGGLVALNVYALLLLRAKPVRWLIRDERPTEDAAHAPTPPHA